MGDANFKCYFCFQMDLFGIFHSNFLPCQDFLKMGKWMQKLKFLFHGGILSCLHMFFEWMLLLCLSLVLYFLVASLAGEVYYCFCSFHVVLISWYNHTNLCFFVPLLFSFLLFSHPKGPQVHQEPNYNSVLDLLCKWFSLDCLQYEVPFGLDSTG